MKKKEDFMKDILKPILPMLISNWIFGIGVIEYPFGVKHRVVSLCITACNLALYLLLICFCYPYFKIFSQQFENNQWDFEIYFWSHVFLVIAAFALAWLRAENLHLVIEQIAVTDYMMENIGMPRDYAKMFRTQLRKLTGFIVIIIFMMTMNSMIVFSNAFDKHYKLVTMLVLNHPTIIIFLVDLLFFNLVGHIHDNLIKLNNLLRELVSKAPKPQHSRIIQRFFSKKDSREQLDNEDTYCRNNLYILQTSQKVQLRLVKSCRLVDNCFGLHILLSLVVAITLITDGLYYLYNFTQRYSVHSEYFHRFLIGYSVTLIYYFTKIYVLSCRCSSISSESVKTGDIISELYDEPSITEEARKEIRNFEIQLIQNTIKFEAHGFIVLDFTLIQTFIGSITTYLMILMQLGNSTR